MFSILTESVEAKYGLPRLLYRFSGHSLHPYIRVLGLLHDTDEILRVLQWMVEYQEELNTVAEQSRNEKFLLRRSLVAIRTLFAHGKDIDEVLVERLKAVIGQLEGWGGWPTEEEVEEYLTWSSAYV
jgi:hypothetical protein